MEETPVRVRRINKNKKKKKTGNDIKNILPSFFGVITEYLKKNRKSIETPENHQLIEHAMKWILGIQKNNINKELFVELFKI